MDAPGPAHFLFIPAVFLIGFVLGRVGGFRAAQQEFERRRRRAKE